MFKERCDQLIRLEDLLQRDVYLVCHNAQSSNAQIDGTMINVFRQMIRFSKRRENAAIVIQTPGGSLNETFYICEFFREYYEGVDTYIVGDCYSGGTVIALSSDNIYMNRSACLGPIDIQLSVPNDQNPWTPDLYGMVNALTKALKDGEATPDVLKAFAKREDILAKYFKMKYTYKELIGAYVKQHCVDENSWENVWNYMAELNLSHGSPLTYRKCLELGLDVKRMPEDIDKLVSKMIRDAENEFGGLVSKSVLYDFYESPDTNILKRALVKGGNGENTVTEVVVTKSTELLGFIESPQAGFVEEMELATTLYGLIPIRIIPIKIGWREEYNTRLVSWEQNNLVEEQIDAATANSFRNSEISVVDKKTYLRGREYIKRTFFDGALDILKEGGIDIDAMSGAEKWKAVADYCVEQQEILDREHEERIISDLLPIFEKEAAELGIDYYALDQEAQDDFVMEVMKRRVPFVVEQLGTTIEEFLRFSEEEQFSLIVEYMYEFELKK